jgi:hypothetical protein
VTTLWGKINLCNRKIIANVIILNDVAINLFQQKKGEGDIYTAEYILCNTCYQFGSPSCTGAKMAILALQSGLFS